MSVNAIANVVKFETAGMPEARHPLAGSAMLGDEAWAEIAGALHLSGRELETVRGVFDNDKETAIAADLGIAARTVHTHMERLYHKLGVTTRVELVLRVMEANLVQRCRQCTSAPQGSHSGAGRSCNKVR